MKKPNKILALVTIIMLVSITLFSVNILAQEPQHIDNTIEIEQRDNIKDVCNDILDTGSPFLTYSDFNFKPRVLTGFATNIDPWGDHATIKGTLISKGFTRWCDVWFVWDTSPHVWWYNYRCETNSLRMYRTGGFQSTLRNLIRGQTIYYMAVANNGYKYDQGVMLSFTIGAPKVETLSVTDVDFSSATLNGKILDAGGVNCKTYFVYDTQSHDPTDSYDFRTPYQTLNSGSFSYTVTNLKPGTKYFYRAIISNDVGTRYGEEKNFTTLIPDNENLPPLPPQKPDGPTNGEVGYSYYFSASTTDPDGDGISYWFDWGDGSNSGWLDPNYGDAIFTSHIWHTPDTYYLKVKAKDTNNLESGFSEYAIINIEVDSTIILIPTDDTFIKNNDINYNGNAFIQIRNDYGYGGGSGWYWRGLINFDLSTIPKNSQIKSAKLYLNYYNTWGINPVGRKIGLFRMYGAWDESTVTGYNVPSSSSNPSSISTVLGSFGWMKWDVTNEIIDMVNGNYQNYGWMIKDYEYWGGSNIPLTVYNSKEAADNQPYLEIILG